MTTDLTEQSLLDLLVEIRRQDPARPLAIRPTHYCIMCPTCNNVCRFDEPFFMCDVCQRAVGQVMR